MIFRKLIETDDRKGFDCGVDSVNRYFHQTARQQASKGLALTYVLVEREESTQVIGFYTLLMSTVACNVVPAKGLPKGRSAPVILLAQFGVDYRFQGQGYGRKLLYDALLTSRAAADRVGCLAVVRDAVDEKARAFYLSRGFEQLTDDPNHLWLSIDTIRQMFSEGA